MTVALILAICIAARIASEVAFRRYVGRQTPAVQASLTRPAICAHF